MEIYRDRKVGKLYLSQRKYLEKVLDRFNMSNCKPVTTPLAAHLKPSVKSCPASKEEIERRSHVIYSSAIGSLIYAMVCSRLDLAYVVSVVSHYMHNPGKDHWEAIKWILRYVQGSFDRCLVFNKSKTATYNIIGFVNSDYSRDLDHRHSP